MLPADLGPAWLTLRYPLTDPRQFDILQSAGRAECSSIN